MRDLHFHLGPAGSARDGGAPPAGCAISQAAVDNPRYLKFSRAYGVACALFTHPRSDDYKEVLGAISGRRALSYQHLELLTSAELDMLAPALEAAEAADLPVVVHLSRHDAHRFPQAEAARLLERILDRYPALRIAVSHCGGENLETAAQAARQCRRVFLDTSRLEETSVRCGVALPQLAECLPLSQLVYGSDAVWPGGARPQSGRGALARLFTGREIDRICERNAATLLRSFSPAT